MLQMRPWKMSLLLEGNNNSKFQLLLTLQSSVFPSDRIRREGESEYDQMIFFFPFRFRPPFLPSLLPSSLPHPPTPSCPHVSTTEPHPPFHQQIHTQLPLAPYLLLEGKMGGDKGHRGAGPRLSRWWDTALWVKCLPTIFFP